jgi:RHS repeat-associated protein
VQRAISTLRTSSGNFFSRAATTPQNTVSTNYFIDQAASHVAPGRWRVADVNNDGKDDLIAGVDEGDDSISAHGGFFKYRCYTWNELTHDFSSCMPAETKDASNAGPSDDRWRSGDRLRWPLWNFADFDGDGRVDLAENDHIRLNLWTNGTLATFALTQQPLDMIDFDDAPNNEIAWPWKAYNRGAEALDVDADGRADLLLSNPENLSPGYVAAPSFPIGDAELMLHGLGLSPAGTTTDTLVPGLSRGTLPWARQAEGEIVVDEDSYFFSVSADVNGDGLKDQVIVRHTTYLGSTNAEQRWSGDDNLGGIGTFVQYNTGRGYTPARRTTMQFRPIEQWFAIGPNTAFDDGDHHYYKWNTSALPAAVDVVDVNNDGREDIVVKSMETWQWDENNPELNLTVQPMVAPPQAVAQVTGDLNIGSTFWHTRIYLSTGDDFKLVENPFDPGLPTANGDRGYIFTRPAQLDDDPSPEYLIRGRGHHEGSSHSVEAQIAGLTSAYMYRVDLDAGPEEVIWAIQDDGASDPRDIFTYRDARFSRDGDGCHYPFSCPGRFPALVDEHHTSQGRDENGQLIYRRMKHRQQDPRVDLRGRGMLGFESTTAIDLDTGAITYSLHEDITTEVGDFFPYAGMATQVTTYTPILVAPTDGQPNLAPGYVRVRVSETTRTPAHKLLYGGKSYFSYVAEEHQFVYDQTMELELVDGEPRLHPVASPNAANVSAITSTAQYDDFGNVVNATTTVAGGETRTTTSTYLNDTSAWLIGLPITQATTSMTDTRRMAYEHDSKGHLSTIHVQPNDIDPDVISTTYRVRDDRGLVIQLAHTAPGVPPRVTNFYHDADSLFVAQTINAAGHETAVLRHPALGVPVLTQDALGVQSLAKYDGFGRLRSTNGPTDLDILLVSRKPFKNDGGHILGLETTTYVSDNSESTAFTDELGRTVHSVVSGFEGEMLHAATHYNLLGQPVRSTRMAELAPSLFTTDVVYDTLGRQLSISAPDGVETTFEYEPLATRTIDAHGHVRTVFHDAHHRPAWSEEELVENGQVNVLTTTFRYGAFDQLSSTTDPAGNTITLRHDVLGRKLSIKDPDAGFTQFFYNGLGDLRREETPKGEILTFGHDDLGRVLWEDGPDGTTNYTYDLAQNGVGQLAWAVAPDGVGSVQTYDSLGRLHKSWTLLDIGELYELEYRYDNFGRLSEIAYPQDPSGERFKALFDYNVHGFAKSVTRAKLAPDSQPQTQLVWETISRDDNLALRRGTFGNGVTVGMDRDPATGMVWKIAAQKTPLISNPLDFQVTYQYDALRNVDLRTWSGTAFGNDTITESFEHDALDRLSGWDVTGPTMVAPGPRSYHYDPMGNLTGVLENNQPVYQATYGVGQIPNALASSTLSSTFQYDAAGRQTKTDSREVTFTPEGKPRSVTVGGVTTDLRYGPGHQRVEKLAPDSRTVYIGGLYEKRITADSTQHVFFVPGDTGIVAQVTRTQIGAGDVTEEIAYLVRDHLGSASAAFDQAGNVEAQLFDPWGERIYHSGPTDMLVSDVLHGYTDQRHEDELGWIDMNARMYDPGQRRFISPDPLVADPLFSTGRNRFAYVLNNPLRYTDPTGMSGEAAYHNTWDSSAANSKTLAGTAPLAEGHVSVPYGLNLPGYTWPVLEASTEVEPNTQVARGESSTEVRGGADDVSGGADTSLLTSAIGFVGRAQVAKQGLEQAGVDMIVNTGIAAVAVATWASDPTIAEATGVDPIPGMVDGLLDAPELTGNPIADVVLHQVPIIRIGQGVQQSARLWMAGDAYGSGYAMAAPQAELAMTVLGGMLNTGASAARTGRLVALDANAVINLGAVRNSGVLAATDSLVVSPNVATELARHGVGASDLASAGITIAGSSPVGASVAATRIAEVLRGLGRRGAKSASADALNLAEAAGLNAEVFITKDGQVLRAFGGTSILPGTNGARIRVVGF